MWWVVLSVNVGKHQHTHSVRVCVCALSFAVVMYFAFVIIAHRIFNHISLVEDARDPNGVRTIAKANISKRVFFVYQRGVCVCVFTVQCTHFVYTNSYQITIFSTFIVGIKWSNFVYLFLSSSRLQKRQNLQTVLSLRVSLLKLGNFGGLFQHSILCRVLSMTLYVQTTEHAINRLIESR